MRYASGVKAKKSLGQNFLMHRATAERIADAARLTKESVVFEIGPGTGMLTEALLKRAGKVIALEADHELIAPLTEKFSSDLTSGKLELLEGDIRGFDPEILPEGYVVVANIPYYLTGDIIRRFLESARQPAAMTLLVQKEVAERIARDPKESILSLSVKAYGTPIFEFKVPKGSFKPAPKVDSAVLSIRGISRANFASAAEERRFFELVKAGFAHKRKLLAKNLAEAGIETLHISPKARAEDLPLPSWLTLVRGG